jgi:O-antigen ligase
MLLGALLAVIIQVGILVATFVFGYNLIDRFLLSNAQRDIVETSGRILLYDQATTIFLANPIFGAGYGNYYSVVSPFPLLQLFRLLYTLKPMPVPIAAHNEFFTVLAETGILGFIGFLLLLYFTVKQAFVLMFRRTLSPVDRLLLVSIWTSLLAYCLYVIFENMFPQNIIYLLMLAGVAHGWFHKAQYEHTAS